MQIKRLETLQEVIEFTDVFNQAIGYSNVPWQYHAQGKCYAVIKNGKMEAGFCLIPGYFNLRAIHQMPPAMQIKFWNNFRFISKNLCDLTAYFIKNLNFWEGIIFTIFLAIRCMFYCKLFFIYTYPTHDHALERYYGKGNPLRIHSGIPEKLPGHGDHMEAEHVEILSKIGIFKILYYRTIRMIKLRRLKK